MDAYSELIERHISACFMKDRCMYFDYGVSDDEPGIVMLYEVYEDADAPLEHKKSAHRRIIPPEELDLHDDSHPRPRAVRVRELQLRGRARARGFDVD